MRRETRSRERARARAAREWRRASSEVAFDEQRLNVCGSERSNNRRSRRHRSNQEWCCGRGERGGRREGDGAASGQRASGAARQRRRSLCVPPSVLLLLSRPEAPSRLEHGKAPPQKHATPAAEEGAHLPRTWRLIVVPLLSLLVRSVAWVRRLPLLLSSRDCIPDLGELEYLTVQSKWSDEDQQSSRAARHLLPLPPKRTSSLLLANLANLSLVCEWACVCHLRPRLLRTRYIAPRECLRSVG